MDKLWKVSRGPIVATEIDIQKSSAINALLIRPVGVLPAKAGDAVRPFAVGLFNELRGLLKADAGITTLRRATAAYVHSKRYYFASAQPDAMRHDLEGSPLEAISPEDRLVAQNRFLALKQKAEDGGLPAPPAQPILTKSEQIRAALLGRRRESAG